MEWKKEVLSEIGVRPINPTPRDWVLLLLHAGDRSPLRGEESLHITFFMMQYPPFNFKPLILSVYSSELHKALEELMAEGLVERSYSFERGRSVELLILTAKGAAEAASLAERVKGSWVVVGEVMIREGTEVLSELEALKKTYNGKEIADWMKLFLERIERADTTFDLWFAKDEMEYMKRLYLRALKGLLIPTRL